MGRPGMTRVVLDGHVFYIEFKEGVTKRSKDYLFWKKLDNTIYKIK
jgi:hypothetical protein